MDKQQRRLYPPRRYFRHVLRELPAFVKQAYQSSGQSIGSRPLNQSSTVLIPKCFASVGQVFRKEASLDTYKNLYDYNGVQILQEIGKGNQLRCRIPLDSSQSKICSLLMDTSQYANWMLGAQAKDLCRLD